MGILLISEMNSTHVHVRAHTHTHKQTCYTRTS